MISKITEHHRENMAYVYLRQSTMGQVLHHRESTERQYALREKALACGWPAQRIRLLDGDLGISGAQAANREDFKTLVADVSLNKVGAIFALEASRLSRSSTDWNRLFELCSLTDTLIIDEDGCYDPAQFNDQLLLGLKGMMSQAELHFIRARLQGGKLNKAQKGALRFPLPVGLCYDEDGNIVKDPDQEVRRALRLLFATFKETGSAYAVTQKFGRLAVGFPKRAYGGVWKGKLIWGRLTHMRVLNIVKNPSYAGAYVYGRYRSKKIVSTDGVICTKIQQVPMASWRVLIKDHHEGYISWEQYLHNLALLRQNQTNGAETMTSSAAREGAALLQGLLICGRCGRRITVRYKGNGGIYPMYECNWLKREGLSGKSCLSLRCDTADEPVTRRVLEVLKPEQIEIALKAMEELERRSNTVDNQWRMRVQRAEYEAQLAERRYEEADPSNRLVAATLESRWNDALLNLEQVRQQHQEFRRREHLELTPEQKERVFALAKDLPRLWNTPTTQAKDRKRMIRLLVKDITVENVPDSRRLILHVRWQGGATEDIHCDRPQRIADRVRYPAETIDRVTALARKLPDERIAQELNREGRLSAKGKQFTASIVRHLRASYSIPTATMKRPEELTVKEVVARLGVSRHMVYYWIRRRELQARKIKEGRPYWITLNSEDEERLRRKAQDSRRFRRLAGSHS